MSWSVVNGEAVPDFIVNFGAEDIAQRLAAMDPLNQAFARAC